MDKFAIVVSAITAFVIGAGGSLGVALVATKGAAVDATVWILAVVLGLVTAAKDVRSLLKFPPVDGGDGPTKPPSASRLPVWLLLGALAMSGCGTPQRPPSAAEQKYFEIKTNVVEVVSWVTNRTEATETTPAAAAVQPVTNRVEQYDFAPNANAGAVATTGSAVGRIWSPTTGGVAGAAIMGIFSLWGLWRSKKRETANELTAAELAQIIQTGREILLKLPDGAKYEAAWKAWMVKHQAETQTIAQVSELVSLAVDNDKAKGVAQTIVNLIQAAK